MKNVFIKNNINLYLKTIQQVRFKIFYEFIKKLKGIDKNFKGDGYKYYHFNEMAIEVKNVY
ncbi:hypothetical protein QIA25_05435 (plasmid) [Borreliella spielmanii]|uniref:Uncharacterized protein n=1 Tax=Borreliella spielmanii A14S TaxID=498742 RepID=C0RCB1_9SPIR|nr:hypothetical protein [Borreliella spielmanii]ACN53389.1 conserved hypothetical protein [Borreliella spielmanii A14S]